MLNYHGMYMDYRWHPHQYQMSSYLLMLLINLECTGHKLHKSSELHTWFAGSAENKMYYSKNSHTKRIKTTCMLSWHLEETKRIRLNSDPFIRKIKQIADPIKGCLWKGKHTWLSTLPLILGSTFTRVFIEISLIGKLKYITLFLPDSSLSWRWKSDF